MKLVTLQECLDKIADKWYNQYRTFQCALASGKSTTEIHLRLKELKPPIKAEDIVAIIGNRSWVKMECDVCLKDVDRVVNFHGLIGEGGSISICKDCATKAYHLFDTPI